MSIHRTFMKSYGRMFSMKNLLIVLCFLVVSGCSSIDLKTTFQDAKNRNYIKSYVTNLTFNEAVDCMVYRMSTYTLLPNPELSIVRNSPNINSSLIGTFYEVDGSRQENVYIHSFVIIGNNGFKDIQHCLSSESYSKLLNS